MEITHLKVNLLPSPELQVFVDCEHSYSKHYYGQDDDEDDGDGRQTSFVQLVNLDLGVLVVEGEGLSIAFDIDLPSNIELFRQLLQDKDRSLPLIFKMRNILIMIRDSIFLDQTINLGIKIRFKIIRTSHPHIQRNHFILFL